MMVLPLTDIPSFGQTVLWLTCELFFPLCYYRKVSKEISGQQFAQILIQLQGELEGVKGYKFNVTNFTLKLSPRKFIQITVHQSYPGIPSSVYPCHYFTVHTATWQGKTIYPCQAKGESQFLLSLTLTMLHHEVRLKCTRLCQKTWVLIFNVPHQPPGVFYLSFSILFYKLGINIPYLTGCCEFYKI